MDVVYLLLHHLLQVLEMLTHDARSLLPFVDILLLDVPQSVAGV